MPPRKSKPKPKYSVQYKIGNKRLRALFTSKRAAEKFIADQRKSGNFSLVGSIQSIAEKQQAAGTAQANLQAQTRFQTTVQQIDGSSLDLRSSPGGEAGKILKSFSIPNYAALVISDPSKQAGFNPAYDRGYRYTTLDEAIERYGSTARHILLFTHFYQDSQGWWHAYVEIDSP